MSSSSPRMKTGVPVPARVRTVSRRSVMPAAAQRGQQPGADADQQPDHQGAERERQGDGQPGQDQLGDLLVGLVREAQAGRVAVQDRPAPAE